MSVPVSAETAVQLPIARRIVVHVVVAVAWLLSRQPPARLCRVLRLLSRGARPAAMDQALAARQAAVSVSARCAGLGCTQRSVAAVLLCRLQGTWPDWCTGFRTRPFAAHAWVEVAGVPVGEPIGMTAFTTVLSVRVSAAPDATQRAWT